MGKCLLYPTTVVLAGTSFVTTALAPIVQFSPITTSPKILAPAPIIVFLPTICWHGIPRRVSESNLRAPNVTF